MTGVRRSAVERLFWNQFWLSGIIRKRELERQFLMRKFLDVFRRILYLDSFLVYGRVWRNILFGWLLLDIIRYEKEYSMTQNFDKCSWQNIRRFYFCWDRRELCLSSGCCMPLWNFKCCNSIDFNNGRIVFICNNKQMKIIKSLKYKSTLDLTTSNKYCIKSTLLVLSNSIPDTFLQKG